jgi:hypothetical protein
MRFAHLDQVSEKIILESNWTTFKASSIFEAVVKIVLRLHQTATFSFPILVKHQFAD